MPQSKTENKEPVKIILADDDKEDQELFEEALAETNILAELATVNTGEQLINKLRDSSESLPDIIFLDINLPVKDGKECIVEIKGDEKLKDIPCVVYSASDHEKLIDDTYDLGANLYFTKQVAFAALVNILRKIMRLNWEEYKPKPIRQKFVVS